MIRSGDLATVRSLRFPLLLFKRVKESSLDFRTKAC